MNTQRKVFLLAICASILLFLADTVQADNPGYIIPSPGEPGAVININGSEGVGEWTGAHSFSITDYGVGTALSAQVKALHKNDGIYLLLVVSDSLYNDNDSVQIRFDLNHNHTSPPEVSDWGVEVLRNGQAKWGAATQSSATWAPVSNACSGCIAVLNDTAGWTIEFRLPTGAPSGLDLGTGTVGIHFMLYDIDQENGLNSARYTQWPQPPAASLNDLLDGTPNQWGNYAFDPATTFPNVAVTGVRRADSDPANYYKINYAGTNRFEVKVKNPGGTAIPDASNVRLNLYLAARGIGESWHRLDTETVLNSDCSNPNWTSYTMPNKSDFCSGTTSLDDISTQSINDVVNNTAMYTIKNGQPMNRLGGESMTISAATENWVSVLDWNTTPDQDNFFKEVIVNGTTYKRQHSCMRAEAIVPNDPNTSDNVRQVNMDFVGVPGAMRSRFFFSLGWAGFAKYNPNAGKEMFLKADLKNMNPQAGWKYTLEGTERIGEDTFNVKIAGTQSRSVQVAIEPPPANVMGQTLKENLIVPPKAGGRFASAAIPSGAPPVYVKVKPGSMLLIANYPFNENDIQNVDLDGEKRLLPSNGPNGLSLGYLERLLEKVGEKFRILLAPKTPLGALVGSFDNFRTSFLISEGVQVKVPLGANYLALGINDLIGLYDDNTGTGFRVKVIEREGQYKAGSSFVSEAIAQETGGLQMTPLSEVIPTICINGYEDIGQTRIVASKPRELYRFIGNMCWGIVNVYPKDRSEKPDQGDEYVETPPPICGPATCGPTKRASLMFASLITVFGIVIIRWRVWRKEKHNNKQKGGDI